MPGKLMTYFLQTLLLFSFCLTSLPVMAKLNVFACEPEWAALAKALGGEELKVSSATTANQDPHHIQARPSLIAKARRADLLICTGAELEVGWLPLLLRKSANGKIQPGQPGHFMASDYVTLLEKPAVLDRAQGDVHATGNPHIHLDPRRIVVVAKALVATLANIDPPHQKDYQQQLQRFNQQWQEAILGWEQQSAALKGNNVVVNHNSWVYLEDWLGLKRVATLEPKPGIPPTSSHLAGVLKRMKADPADLIIYASFKNERPAKWLSAKTDIPFAALPFSVDKDEELIHWFDKLITTMMDAQQ